MPRTKPTAVRNAGALLGMRVPTDQPAEEDRHIPEIQDEKQVFTPTNMRVDLFTERRKRKPEADSSSRGMLTRAMSKTGASEQPFQWLNVTGGELIDVVRGAGLRKKKKRRLVRVAVAEKAAVISKPKKKTKPKKRVVIRSLDPSEGSFFLGELSASTESDEIAAALKIKTPLFIESWETTPFCSALSIVISDMTSSSSSSMAESSVETRSHKLEIKLENVEDEKRLEYLLRFEKVTAFFRYFSDNDLRISVLLRSKSLLKKAVIPHILPTEQMFNRHLRYLLQSLRPKKLSKMEIFNDHNTDDGKKYGLVSQVFDVLKQHRADIEHGSRLRQHKDMIPELRGYQLRACRWMLQREKSEILSKSTIPVPWERITAAIWVGGQPTKENIELFLNRCTGHLTYAKPPTPLPVPGGILADEMGLGKTIETLHLLLCRPRPPSTLFIPDTIYPEKKMQKSLDPACSVCQELHSETKHKKWVQCDYCDSWNHAGCVMFDNKDNKEEEEPYCCPFCWRDRCEKEPLRAKTTLIISPAAIVGQWATEIERHTRYGALKVCTYYGIRGLKYYPPSKLAEYDVVLTTYGVLRGEIYHSQGKEFERKTFRKARRRRSAPSPLMDIEWWRIVIDEAQMAESSTAHAARMCQLLKTRNRWAVTGTPINKTVNDLWGLLIFLRAYPYAHKAYWQRDILLPLTQQENFSLISRTQALSHLGENVGPLFWRETKAGISCELGIPPQTEKVQLVFLSEVEAYNYQLTAKLCKRKALELLRKFGHYLTVDDGTSVRLGTRKSMDVFGGKSNDDGINDDSESKNSVVLHRESASAVLSSLLSLRQACCHPMLARSANRAFDRSSESLISLHRRKQATMPEVLQNLISREEKECTQAVRERALVLNGLAGIALIKKDPQSAVECYTQTLELANTDTLWITTPDSSIPKAKRKSYKGKSMVDKTQQLHAVHHLRKTLEIYTNIPIPSTFSAGNIAQLLSDSPSPNKGTRKGSSTPSTPILKNGSSPSKNNTPSPTKATNSSGVQQESSPLSNSLNGDKKSIESPEASYEYEPKSLSDKENIGKRRSARRRLSSSSHSDHSCNSNHNNYTNSSFHSPTSTKYGRGQRSARKMVVRTLEKREREIREEYITSSRLRVAQATSDAMNRMRNTELAWDQGGWEGNFPWWLDALSSISGNESKTETFIGRVIDGLHVRSAMVSKRLLDRCRTLDGLQYVVSRALDDLRKARDVVIKNLKRLHAPEGPPRARVIMTGNCKICCEEHGRKGPACEHCRCLKDMGKYEGQIFQTREVGTSEYGGAINASAVANFTAEKGRRVDAQQEAEFILILRTLYMFTSKRRKKNQRSPMEFLDFIKREYFSLSVWWKAQKYELQEMDELEMSLICIRIRGKDEKISEQEKPYVVEEWQIENMKADYQARDVAARAACATKVGQLFYLRSLATGKDGKQEDGAGKKSNVAYECPICMAEITAKRVGMIVFTCGHLVCYKCGLDLLEFSRKRHSSNSKKAIMVQCPTCRKVTSEHDLGYVERKVNEKPENKDKKECPEEEKILLDESASKYGAKIQTVLSSVLQLLAKDPAVKIVIFSQWTAVLALLGDAFQSYGIDFEAPNPSRKDFHSRLERFKRPSHFGKEQNRSKTKQNWRQRKKIRDGLIDKGCTLLLLQLKSGGQGLNLVEATHVMFVDPSLNPAQHLQVCRSLYFAHPL